tara:strand:- start:6 stop:833 length:828 start_codon:yes stop_codon:yes gene_type:complete
MSNNEEKILRENIKGLIRHVKQKRSNEKTKLRELIRSFANHEIEEILKEASTPDVQPTPNKSTGINVLEELLKKIIPVLETDYKSLTTDSSQRESFRSHIINGVVNTLTPAKANTDAGEEASDSINIAEAEVEEELNIDVGDDDKFIDIRTDAEKSADEEEEEEDPVGDFGSGIEGDETGRNVAYQSFKKIESSIIDSYELLSNEEDQELFYDYLIANLKLYFDKFEGELSSAVEEPTNQAYDMAVSDADAAAGGDELAPPDDEEIALQELIDSL